MHDPFRRQEGNSSSEQQNRRPFTEQNDSHWNPRARAWSNESDALNHRRQALSDTRAPFAVEQQKSLTSYSSSYGYPPQQNALKREPFNARTYLCDTSRFVNSSLSFEVPTNHSAPYMSRPSSSSLNGNKYEPLSISLLITYFFSVTSAHLRIFSTIHQIHSSTPINLPRSIRLRTTPTKSINLHQPSATLVRRRRHRNSSHPCTHSLR